MKHMTMHAQGGFGWLSREALLGVICVLAVAGGCAQRPNILREAGAKEVRLEVVRMSFPHSLGIPGLIARELETVKACAGISVMRGAGEFEKELAARFSWMEGFRRTSSYFTMLDLGSVAPVLWEARAQAPPSRSVFEASISTRVQLSLSTEPNRLELVMTDRIEPLDIHAPRGSYEDGKLVLGVVPRVSGERALVEFRPLIVREGEDYEEFEELGFSADAAAGEALLLACVGVPGSFGEKAFSRHRGAKGAEENVPLPLSPPAVLALGSPVGTFYDQLLVILPIFEGES